ncbi:MAG: putative Glutathione transferase FosA [Nitrospira sp.]|nr:putative Glutathione transferase FosA [Nitrospira sp.]
MTGLHLLYGEGELDVPTHYGLRHLALRVTDLARSRAFYERFLAMKVVWEPDQDNVYFSSGSDNLALHQIAPSDLAQYQPLRGQLLDHFGVILPSPAQVDELFRDVRQDAAQYGATIAKPPKQHRDGSYSFYFTDPDGNVIQALYEPTISSLASRRQD